MEYYNGVYVFEKSKTIELAPGIYARVINEVVDLEKGHCEVVLDVEGNRIVIRDSNERTNTRSWFVLDGVEYSVQGRLFQLDDDVVMYYTVYRDSESWLNYSKEESTETHHLGEVFTIRLYDNPTTGYSTRLTPSDGLMIVNKESSLECTNPGCGNYATYFIKGTKRGRQKLLISTGQVWDPSTTKTNTMYFDII